MKGSFSNLYRALIIINFASIVTKKINKLKTPTKATDTIKTRYEMTKRLELSPFWQIFIHME